MKIIDFFRSRLVLFLIQILILSLFIYSIGYKFNINLDIGILKEQEVILQFLANYIMFDGLLGLYQIYIGWILVSLIPIFVYNNFKKAYSMNLMTFFLLNFFFYVFLCRYSPEYFNSNFQFHFFQTILLGIIIIGFSIGLSLALKKILKLKNITHIENLASLASMGKKICPYCGAEFDSIPKFCSKCNSDLSLTSRENSGDQK